jgi:hypothetical protein
LHVVLLASPSAAPKDSTTVATRISGATSARSSTPSTTSTTSMTSGMITRLSRCEAIWTSRLMALLPPTGAPPSPSGRPARSALMVAWPG